MLDELAVAAARNLIDVEFRKRRGPVAEAVGRIIADAVNRGLGNSTLPQAHISHVLAEEYATRAERARRTIFRALPPDVPSEPRAVAELAQAVCAEVEAALTHGCEDLVVQHRQGASLKFGPVTGLRPVSDFVADALRSARAETDMALVELASGRRASAPRAAQAATAAAGVMTAPAAALVVAGGDPSAACRRRLSPTRGRGQRSRTGSTTGQPGCAAMGST